MYSQIIGNCNESHLRVIINVMNFTTEFNTSKMKNTSENANKYTCENMTCTLR